MTTLPAITAERIEIPVNGISGPMGGTPPSASDIMSMLRRRTLLIVFLSVMLCGIGLAGFYAWWMYFPGFLGESLVELISNIPETTLNLEQQRLQQDEHERFVLSQAVLLKSPTILSEALQINAVQETQWYKDVKSRKREPLTELTEQLSAAPVRGTNYLRVSMETRRPEDAPVVVNEVVNRWLYTVRTRTAEEYASAPLASAQTNLDEVVKVITEKRDRLKDIAQRLPAGAKEDPANNIVAQLVRQFGEQTAQLQLEVSHLEQYRKIYNDPEGVAVTAEDRALVEQDPQVAELSRALFLFQQQRASDERVYGAGHAATRQIDAQIAAAEERLAQLRIEKLRERRADIKDSANTGYENTRHALFLAQENLAKAEAQLQDQDRLLFDYQDLEAEINQDTKYRLDLEDYIKGLRRVMTQRRAINVNVAQSAVKPLERNSPSLWLLPVIAVFSLVLSVGLALALELIDTRVRTSQDIVRHLDVALLGAIPDTDDEEIAIKHVETASRDAPGSMVADAFRRIRTNLQFSAPVERQRTVLITSPGPEDGKTTVACNLAFTIAQGGRRVLLVDANLRRPALSQIFGAGQRGLSNILVGDATLTDCLFKTNVPRVDLLPSGRTPPNPAELLDGAQWRNLVEEMTSKYDQVIIDGSPVLLANDSVLMATEVDGVILVVRANQNSRGVARRACHLLHNVRAKLFGIVLNAARVTRGGYFREQLRAYYDYQPDEKELARRG